MGDSVVVRGKEQLLLNQNTCNPGSASSPLRIVVFLSMAKKKKNNNQQTKNRDFSGDPVAKNPSLQSRGLASIPGQGTKFHMPQ